ncbi:MAG TPA: hypothetical protein VIT38_07935 [Allosphingosinicella sp.]
MKLACLLDGHQAAYADVRNQGLRFSQCRLCGCDLIRMGGGWKPAPKEFRVVWRPAGAPAPEPAPLRLVRNLPVPSRPAFWRRMDRMGHIMRRSAALAADDLRAARGALARLGRVLRLPRRPRQLLLPMKLPARIPPGSLALRVIGSLLEKLSSLTGAMSRAAIRKSATFTPKAMSPAPEYDWGIEAMRRDPPVVLLAFQATMENDYDPPCNLPGWLAVEEGAGATSSGAAASRRGAPPGAGSWRRPSP